MLQECPDSLLAQQFTSYLFFRNFTFMHDLSRHLILPAVLLATAALLSAGCCTTGRTVRLTTAEKALIEDSGSPMRVLLVTDPADSAVLRMPSTDIAARDLKSETYRTLADRMIATVKDPSQDGVGIAAPQVGLNRRVIAVMRYDKPGQPFEVYPNIRIESMSDEKQTGPEGCLSVPGRRGEVERSRQVVVYYTDPLTLRQVRDTVEGYTAVIFQHETDHLDGILYTDRLLSEAQDGTSQTDGTSITE